MVREVDGDVQPGCPPQGALTIYPTTGRWAKLCHGHGYVSTDPRCVHTTLVVASPCTCYTWSCGLPKPPSSEGETRAAASNAHGASRSVQLTNGAHARFAALCLNLP